MKMLYASTLIFSSSKIMSDFSDRLSLEQIKSRIEMYYREILMSLATSTLVHIEESHHPFISRIYSPNSSHNHSAGFNVKNHVAGPQCCVIQFKLFLGLLQNCSVFLSVEKIVLKSVLHSNPEGFVYMSWKEREGGGTEGCKQELSRRYRHRGACCESNALLWLWNMGQCP